MLDFQHYLRSINEPHSIRDLARLTGVGHSTVNEQLVIAAALSERILSEQGLAPDALSHAPHRTLLRIAKLPPYLRTQPLRDVARTGDNAVDGGATPVAAAREARRSEVYTMLRKGEFRVNLSRPIPELSRTEAHDCLDMMLPALARLAEVVISSRRSHYIGLTGNGGILVYLAPGSHGGFS